MEGHLIIKFYYAWNNHPLSTESNYSPLQLFLRYSIGNPLFIDNVFPSITANVVRDDIPSISVPEINLPLSDSALQRLYTSVDPLQESNSYGADIYMRTVTLVYQLMQDENLLS